MSSQNLSRMMMPKQPNSDALLTGCIGWFYGKAIPESVVYQKSIFVFERVDPRLLKLDANRSPIEFLPYFLDGDVLLVIPPAFVMRNATKLLLEARAQAKGKE